MTIQALYTLFQECQSISTDTRRITPNSMFFALKGENFNGNSFAKTALELGANYSIVDEKEYLINDKCILVDDVLKTLQELANYHRKYLNTPIIALTGSNGKTTTKELINAVLSTQFKTAATKGNLNNHIGVPLTLLSITKDIEIGIIEMGANHPKEIEHLCEITAPDYGLITNFGKAHLEGFGSIEGVIKAKSELYEHLKSHKKTIFINIDDPVQVRQVAHYDKVITFGTSDSNSALKLKSAQPLISLEYHNTRVNTHLTGAYNFNNICAAVAIGEQFKITPENIKFAIENYVPTNNRSQVIKKGSNIIILDAYNANPTSMMAALENFKQTKSNQKIVFLGDMFELGTDAELEHQNIVNYIEEDLTANVNLIGSNFFKTKTTKPFVKKFETFETLKVSLNKKKHEDKLILIKGSRGMALERILEFL